MIAILYTIFFAFTMPVLFFRNRLAGTIYSVLFLYSIFAIVGYLYFPGMSESILAYFGDQAGYVGASFIFLSMVAFFTINLFLYRPRPAGAPPERGLAISFDRNNEVSAFSILLVYGLAAAFAFFLFLTFEDLSWSEAQQDDISLRVVIFIAAFKLSVGILCFLYICIMSKVPKNYAVFIPAFLFYLVTFLVASVKLGNRTDPAALIVGILFFESSRRTLDAKTILRSLLLVLIGIIGLSVIEFFRYDTEGSIASLTDKIIQNDYFAPAHMLFASIAYDFVDLNEVIASNFNNALILQDYPYLQQSVTDLFNLGVATRSAGYAFYIFSEGYIAFGFLGFLYNATVTSSFLRLWNSFAFSDSKFFNTLILSILATMSINVCRSQSSQYIKILYTYFIPVMIFIVIILGVRVGLQRRVIRDDLT